MKQWDKSKLEDGINSAIYILFFLVIKQPEIMLPEYLVCQILYIYSIHGVGRAAADTPVWVFDRVWRVPRLWIWKRFFSQKLTELLSAHGKTTEFSTTIYALKKHHTEIIISLQRLSRFSKICTQWTKPYRLLHGLFQTRPTLSQIHLTLPDKKILLYQTVLASIAGK